MPREKEYLFPATEKLLDLQSRKAKKHDDELDRECGYFGSSGPRYQKREQQKKAGGAESHRARKEAVNAGGKKKREQKRNAEKKRGPPLEASRLRLGDPSELSMRNGGEKGASTEQCRHKLLAKIAAGSGEVWWGSHTTTEREKVSATSKGKNRLSQGYGA